MPSTEVVSDHPVRVLVLSFLAWKTLLLIIATTSPGPGYDTSASLIGVIENPAGELPAPLRYLVGKLTKWDAIYFVKAANRGYVYEQEWAFSWGFSRVIALCASGVGKLGVPHYEGLEALVGIVISHLAHLFSALVVFALGRKVYPSLPPGFALTAALLHNLSPGGLFLSAPYAESSCALLAFSGILLFTESLSPKGQPSAWRDLLCILSGISLGIAAMFRSNGILNGLIMLEEAFRVLISLSSNFSFPLMRRLLATGLGGLSVGAGFLLPQYIAWSEYCGQENASVDSLRPWCRNAIPSIYSFVQEHYWNVGLFRYWTLSNVPLFILATPMITLMAVSGFWALRHQTNENSSSLKIQDEGENLSGEGPEGFPLLRNMAISQLALTLLTLTTAHVQIITRISSANPVWLWYLAAQFRGGNSSLARSFVRFMVIYAIVQGGLFASFLPPA